MKGRISNVVAGCFAMAAFAIALIAAMSSGNPTGSVLWRAVIALVICYPIGLIIGLICERVVDNHVNQHRTENPVPPRVDEPSAAARSSGASRPKEKPMSI